MEKLVLEERDLREMPYKDRQFIIRGLIAEGSITIINGPRGCGKSYLAMAIANSAVRGFELGPWETEKMVNTMIVDGELPMVELLERIYYLSRSCIGKHRKLYFYADAHLHELGEPHINLVERKSREFITKTIEDKHIGLLVLDNLSALCPGIDENEKVPFDPINRWLLDLRYAGVTVVEVHHTGKGGDQRGTSAHEDHVDLALTLSRPQGYQVADGCAFNVKATKDRGFVFKRDQVCLQLDTEDEGLLFVEIDGVSIERATRLILSNPEATEKDAQELGISRATFYRARKKLRTRPESTNANLA